MLESLRKQPPPVEVPAEIAERPSVAVLFFDNLSGDPELEWLRTGLAELMVTGLSRSAEIDVVSTDRVYQILEDLDPRPADDPGAALGFDPVGIICPMEKTTERYDTFHDWQWQLWRACVDDRVEDVAAIASLRAPDRVALDHVEVVEEHRVGLKTSRTESRPELMPYRAMAGTEARERPKPLPSLPARETFRTRRYREKLLRKPFELKGPSPFWARSTRCLKVLLARMKAEEKARAAVGERLTACVRVTLEHGFDGH